MMEILIPVGVMTAVGLIAGLMLAIAAKFMTVKSEERVEALIAVLPGANCGACGHAGCAEYAESMVFSGAKTNLCVPGGETAAKAVSEIMGVKFEEVTKRRAVVRCSGDRDTSKYIMEYDGLRRCAACNSFYQGRRSCTSGCLGFGDCAEVCKFGAISVKNELVYIDPCLCTGCGACVEACPNGLISTIPAEAKVYVGCLSHDKGAYTRSHCTVGCIGCGKCEKNCPADAIKVENNLAEIDYSKCINCGKCAEVCPVHVIKTL